MKLLINYDFFNAIRNVNEPLTPMKIVRNEIKYALITPLWIADGCIGDPKYALSNLLLWYGIYMAIDLSYQSIYKKKISDGLDSYAYEASTKLKKLSAMLDDINVKTNYEMLLKSELYERKLKVESSDEKLLSLKEEKYIYVPSYGFDGQEKETSILQEHDIGSRTYMLSVGEPAKQYRRVLVNNHA